ncbi:phospholipase A1-like [Schistocerca nitens]|uniref:phospholipase A1-like n=1 Tax=Schistocerca nitens TaxID=7011 RepID=UPI00211933E5|nr:phospholipase A1-like [Schistocerca nitens]
MASGWDRAHKMVGATAFSVRRPGAAESLLWNMVDARYWRCVLKRSNTCPDPEIRFFLYTPEAGWTARRQVDVRSAGSLHRAGWDPRRRNVIIVHGFNGTESKTPMTLLRRAYLSRGDHNVFTVDWEPLTYFPCYLSAISNTRLVAQCSAQLYAHLTYNGAAASRITCVGHSLGAHICGMMSNHLSRRMDKIIGLDPARPLLDRFGDAAFRLTRDDARVVQVVHTNAGALGEAAQTGHLDFCINGGAEQPGCKGHRLRRARCSHFQSACYFAEAVAAKKPILGYPCSASCPKRGRALGLLPGPPVSMGADTPDGVTGTYCVSITHGRDCKFD